MTWLQSLVVACVQAITAAGVAGWIVAWLTQRWIERRERRNRRYELRLDLYRDIIEWIDEIETAVADGDGTGRILPVDMQREKLRLHARLQLLGSDAVQAAFKDYRLLTRRQYEDPLERRGADLADKCWQAREKLIETMAKDIRQE